MHNCAKCHHCRICKTYFREGSFFGPPNPWAAPKNWPIINKVKIVLIFSNKTFYQTCECNSQVLTNFTMFSNFTFWLLLCFFMTDIQAYWIQRFFNLANKIFTKKDIHSARKIAWNIKSFSVPFFNHFIQSSPP